MAVTAGKQTQGVSRGCVNLEIGGVVQESAILHADSKSRIARNGVIYPASVDKRQLPHFLGMHIDLDVVRDIVGKRRQEDPGATRIKAQIGAAHQQEGLQFVHFFGIQIVHVDKAVLGDGGGNVKVINALEGLRILHPSIRELDGVMGIEFEPKTAHGS